MTTPSRKQQSRKNITALRSLAADIRDHGTRKVRVDAAELSEALEIAAQNIETLVAEVEGNHDEA